MPVTSPIPLPGSGVGALSGSLDTMFQDLLNKKKMAMQKQQFDQELALKKQQEARLGENSGLNRQLLEQQILNWKHKNDPQYALQQLQQKLDLIQGLENKSGRKVGGVQNSNSMIAPGNIDLNNRPMVKNPDGTYSTVFTMGISEDGKHINIPRISDDGKILSPQEAIEQFHKTGKHLGIYNSKEAAEKAAQGLHEDQANQYDQKAGQQGNIAANSTPGVRPKDGVSLVGQQWYNAKGEPVYADEEPTKDKNTGSSGLNFEDIKRGLTYQALGLKAPPQVGLAYTGPARHAIDLARIKKEYGKNSEEYLNAKAEYDAALDAKKDLRDLRARTKAGLKVGEKEFFDEQTGEPLGKEIPLTAKERESEEGNILFNELYPYVYKGAAPFSGEGAIDRLEQAAAHYKTDPRAKKLFDDFLLSEKMLAATTVNEASTLKAGKTNQTYNRLRESLEAQDVPKLIKKFIKEYQLPSSAQLQAAMRYQKLLSDARSKARKGTPATQKLYYNPEQQASYEQQKSNEDLADTSNENENVVIVIDPNGKRFETTKENAAHLPKGWKRG
jgi:hypothetical protein